MKKVWYPFCLAEITLGRSPFTLLSFPSSPSSQKNKNSHILSAWLSLPSWINPSKATAIARSKEVPTFLRWEGERLRINFLFGRSIPTFLKVDLIRSFASLILASGSPIISIAGSALLESASITISCPINQRFVKVLVCIIIEKKLGKSKRIGDYELFYPS